MEHLDKVYKIGSVATGVMVGYLFGGWSLLLQILLIFMIIDQISGLFASYIEGKLSSKIGFKGIAKKVMIFFIVAVAHLIDQAMGSGHMIRDAVVFFYLGNELLSFIENVGRAGIPLPAQFKNAVSILKGKGEGKK